MWNMKILENFYDIKCSDTGTCDSTGMPILKIRKINNDPLKQLQGKKLSQRNKVRIEHSYTTEKRYVFLYK